MNKSNILIDNWTIETASTLINDGISYDQIHQIVPNKSSEGVIREFPYFLVQIESLFNILIDVVTRDVLIVDDGMIHVWKDRIYPIDNLYKKEILVPQNFVRNEENRNRFYEILVNLNLPNNLIEAWDSHIERWKNDLPGQDPFLSTVMGGTIGYLNRSSQINVSYSPHPTRMEFLKHSVFQNKFNATLETFDWVQNQRQRFVKDFSVNGEYSLSQLQLNPIIIDIIESSSSIPNLFTTAIQLRDHYKPFRKYILKYQVAMEAGDLKAMRIHKRKLDEVQEYIFGKYGTAEFTIGAGTLGLKQKTNIIQQIKTSFGISAILKRLVLSKNTIGTMKKFMTMLGEKNNEILETVVKHFSAQEQS
jgi:hypothetical protein